MTPSKVLALGLLVVLLTGKDWPTADTAAQHAADLVTPGLPLPASLDSTSSTSETAFLHHCRLPCAGKA